MRMKRLFKFILNVILGVGLGILLMVPPLFVIVASKIIEL